jgi:transposase InsO family protein
MERWFGGFKRESGNLNQYKDPAQLHEAIALTVHYYNTERIHLALRMSPTAYAASLMSATLERDRVSEKVEAWQAAGQTTDSMPVSLFL